jgi:hypothetical protein
VCVCEVGREGRETELQGGLERTRKERKWLDRVREGRKGVGKSGGWRVEGGEWRVESGECVYVCAE